MKQHLLITTILIGLLGTLASCDKPAPSQDPFLVKAHKMPAENNTGDTTAQVNRQ